MCLCLGSAVPVSWILMEMWPVMHVQKVMKVVDVRDVQMVMLETQWHLVAHVQNPQVITYIVSNDRY